MEGVWDPSLEYLFPEKKTAKKNLKTSMLNGAS